MIGEYETAIERAVEEAILNASAALTAAKRMRGKLPNIDPNAFAILKDRYTVLGRAIKVLRDEADRLRAEAYR